MSLSLLAWVVDLGLCWIDDMDLRRLKLPSKYVVGHDLDQKPTERPPNARVESFPRQQPPETDTTKMGSTRRFTPEVNGIIVIIIVIAITVVIPFRNRRRHSHQGPAELRSGNPFLDQNLATCWRDRCAYSAHTIADQQPWYKMGRLRRLRECQCPVGLGQVG